MGQTNMSPKIEFEIHSQLIINLYIQFINFNFTIVYVITKTRIPSKFAIKIFWKKWPTNLGKIYTNFWKSLVSVA